MRLPEPEHDSREALATLPFSSGTTGLPKGVMLSHYNLVANVYQTLTPGEFGAITEQDVLLCFLPLYHIYGLTVGLNLTLMRGCTLVLMPRFDCERSLETIVQEGVTRHPLRASDAAGVLPGGGTGKISARTSPALGEVGSGTACAGTGAPLYSEHRHSDSPGLWNDRSLAGNAHGISSA